MRKIQSFTVDHMTLMPGVYVSRTDEVRSEDRKIALSVTTYDVRMTRPNFEPVMNTGEIHTIEHLGATWLRNNDQIKGSVLYWGPMGCRTGFYLILSGTVSVPDVIEYMKQMFAFIADFEGDIPGAKPEECGNYSDMDLTGAKVRAASYVKVLQDQTKFEY